MTRVEQNGPTGTDSEKIDPEATAPATAGMDAGLLTRVQAAGAVPVIPPHGLAARAVARLRRLRGQNEGSIILSDGTVDTAGADPGRTMVAGHVVAVLAQAGIGEVADLVCLGGRAGPAGIRVDVSLAYGARGDAVTTAAHRAATRALTTCFGSDLPDLTVHVVDVHTP